MAMESSVCNLEKFSLPVVPSSTGTPSPSTSTLSSLGSNSPKRRSATPDTRTTSAVAKSCVVVAPTARVLVQQQQLHQKSLSSATCVPNASDQIDSLIVAQLKNGTRPVDTVTGSRPSVQPAVKETKAKKEPKKRASLKREAKVASAPTPSSITSGKESVSENGIEARKLSTSELSEGKIRSPRESPRPEAGQSKGSPSLEAGDQRPPSNSADKERLTLTFVINRENNSASVKSPVKDNRNPDRSPHSSSVKNSPRSESGKRKISSTSNTSSKGKKKHRSSRSSGPDTSSESETRLKIKFGGINEPLVETTISSPAGEKISKSGDNDSTSSAQKQAISRKQESRSFDRLLEIAASERQELNNRREQERLLDQSGNPPVIPDTSRPPTSTSSSSRPPLVTQNDFAKPVDGPGFGKRSHPASPAVVSERPGSGSTDQTHAVSPLLPHVVQDSTPPPHHHMSSLQSMKNLASLTSSLAPTGYPVAMDAAPMSQPQPPKRKPGRPPKKSISESWASSQDSLQMQSSCMQSRSDRMPVAPPSHMQPQMHHPSFPSCQMDQFIASHNNTSSSNNNNESIDYSFGKGGRSGNHPLTGSSPATQSSVIQSSTKGSSRQSASNRSADFAATSNYYPHPAAGVRGHPYAGMMPPHALHPDAGSFDSRATGNMVPSSSPGASGQQMSVIRRHESPGFAPMPPNASAFYGMISPHQSYPPMAYESLQKEFHRYNMMQQSLTTSPRKLLRPSPLDGVCRRS